MKTPIKRSKYYFALGIALVASFSGLVTFLGPTPSALAASATWVDENTITSGGTTYSGPNVTSGEYIYSTATVSCAPHNDYISFAKNPTVLSNPQTPGTLHTYSANQGAQHDVNSCNESQTSVNLSNPGFATLPTGYTQCGSINNTSCVTGIIQQSCNHDAAINGTDPNTCVQQTLATLKQGVSSNSTSAPVCTGNVQGNCASNLTSDGSTNSTAGDPQLECGTTSTLLDWILCPIVNLVNTGVRALDNLITSLLQVDPKIVTETGPGSANSGALYYKAWQSFRSIALAVVVIAALVMLIGQGLGFEVLDAYTIKKVMPRLVVAIIGITLSWQIIKWLIVFTNDVGYGVSDLLFFPFKSLGNVNLGLGSGFIITLLSTGAILAMGIGILLSLAFTAFMGLLVAFLVLVLRQLVIVILILSAPLAIACYILPNTQNIWKLWHESFSKALMMFPIIMAFLAVGKIFALISSGQDATVVGKIIAFVAYIIPYFLIPLTFRFAGGALRTLGGFVNDRSSGLFDGMKKGRQARWKDRKTRAASQHLYSSSNPLGRFGNKVGTWATDPTSNAAYSLRKVPGFKGAGARVASQVEHARVSQSSKLFEELNKSGYNDKAYRILSGAHGQIGDGTLDINTQKALAAEGLLGKAPQSIGELQRVAHILSGSTSASEQIAASAIEGSAGRLASLYKDPEMGKASLQAAGLIGLSAHGFADGNDLEKVGNDLQGKNKESVGFAQAIVSTAQVAGARSRPDIKAGYGIEYKNGKFVNGIGPNGSRAHSLVMSLASQDLSGAKGGAIDALEPEISNTLISPNNNERTAMRDQLFQIAGQYSSASADVKAKVLGIIQKRGLAGQFQNYQRGVNPAVAGQTAANPAGQNQPTPGAQNNQNQGGQNNQSDRRLKRNIVKVAVADNGLQLYRFQYLWSDQVYVGVMAQDLVESHPEALAKDHYGYYTVDYAKLGMQMLTLEEWESDIQVIQAR